MSTFVTVAKNNPRLASWVITTPLLVLSLALLWFGYGRYILAQVSYAFPVLNFSWNLPGFTEGGSTQPATLVINKLNLEAPIQRDVPINDQAKYDDALLHGVALASTSAPLEATAGNSFIFGHSSRFAITTTPYDAIFALLPKLQAGDQMQIVSNGQTADYKVTISHSIKATDLQYLDNSATRELTLITCWPVGTNFGRWVVQAVKTS